MTLNSMTGFAEIRGGQGRWTWVWDMRGVNGRGLDLRLRLPEGFEALEEKLRSATRATLARGNVTISLRIHEATGAAGGRLNTAALGFAVGALREAEEAAMAAGLHLGPASAGDILALRGVIDNASPSEDKDITAALEAGITPLIAGFTAARQREGAGLGRALTALLGRIGALTEAARATLEARTARAGAGLRAKLDLILAEGPPVDEARLAQELALLAVKGDVSEELDRLDLHLAAARDLLTGGGAPGRKLDFLMQEFNREANTLCAKSASAELTAIGLDLKVTIDQAREQVQNLE